MGFDRRGFLLAVVVTAVAAELVGKASAATYIVGDTMGWTVPSSPTAYSDWASQHVFRAGDVLVFNFPTGLHDAAQVTKTAFDTCSSTSPIVLSTVGPWNTTLTSTGEHYYICTFGTHCTIGQKLAINVTATSPTPTPAPTPSTPMPVPTPTPTPSTPMPVPTPTPTPTPMTTPSPTPSGSPAPTPSGSPAPGSAPTPTGSGSPTPGGPGTGTAPSSTTTPGDMSPPAPPSPSAATLSTTSVKLAVFTLLGFGIMI